LRYLALLFVGAAAISTMSAAQAKQTFTGTITDNECAGIGHARMKMGPTDAECARACVDLHGVPFVLESGKQVYTLSDQQAPAKLAGQRVRVVGTLDAKTGTIQVESIAPAK
jgi:hypothetical protein